MIPDPGKPAAAPHRAAAAALRLLPVVFSLAVYWNGIRCWFVQDDFAWLGLRLQIHSPGDLLHVLFAPMAQGTIRPLSERIYFMGLYELFGLDALPFRIVAFLTQTVNLLVLGSIAWKLTRSRAAAFFAPLFWGVHPVLGVPMTWTSTFNQLLCAAFVMGAFRLFLEYAGTGRRRYYWAQFAVFLAGFGALELNVVYPALAAAYALLAARPFLLSTLPLGAVSAAYALLHNAVAPKVQTGVYAMHLDASIFSTFLRYWVTSFGWSAIPDYTADRTLLALTAAAPWLFTAVLLGTAIVAARRRPAVLLPYAWFLIAIAPVLPLRDHFSEYYLTLPSAGLAIGGAWALAFALHRGRTAAVAGGALALLFLAAAVPTSRWISEYHMLRGKTVRDLVWSVERIRELHPGKAIFLHNVTAGLYWAGFADDPFRLLGFTDVYLTPESAQAVPDLPEEGRDRVIPRAAAFNALNRNQAVVYSTASYPLHNITRRYHGALRATPPPPLADFVNVGRPYFAAQLGEGWYPIEGGYRWIARRAMVRLGRPEPFSGRLRIRGYCPADQLRDGPLKLRVSADGRTLPELTITQPDHFDYQADLGPVASDAVEVAVEVDRTFRQGDRDAGVAFGTFSLQ